MKDDINNQLHILHDALLKSVIISESNDKNIELGFVLPNGNKAKIFLQDIVCIQINDFWEGNIVLDASVLDFQDIDKIEIANLFHEDLAALDAPRFEKLFNELKAGTLLFFELNSSYGCQLTAICKKISYATTNSRNHTN